MKIERDTNTMKIHLPKYKINVKTIKTGSNICYQYTCILPPFLTSYFNISENTAYEDKGLVFYTDNDFKTNNNTVYITSSKIMNTVHETNSLNYMYADLLKYNTTEELENKINSLPKINYKLYDNIHLDNMSTLYKQCNSNTYRFTLISKLFKDLIDTTKDNYILFTIDTAKEDMLYNKGVVSIEILQE